MPHKFLTGIDLPQRVAYTPAIVAASPGATPPTFSDVTARYRQLGKELLLTVAYTVATRGTASGGINVPLPNGLSVQTKCPVAAINQSTGSVVYALATGTVVQLPVPGGDGQVFSFSGIFEVA